MVCCIIKICLLALFSLELYFVLRRLTKIYKIEERILDILKMWDK